jgi:hypothetical protein
MQMVRSSRLVVLSQPVIVSSSFKIIFLSKPFDLECS